MLQIDQEIAGESLRALQSFAQGLSQSQANVLMALLNGLARNLVSPPPPVPSEVAETADAPTDQSAN